MAIQMAVFALGSLLMLVAILGGGFEVKELKVPKVGRSSRMAACACGMLFIFLGIYLDRRVEAAPVAAAQPAASGAEVAAAPLPQIVLISGLAGQPAVRMGEIAQGAPQQLGDAAGSLPAPQRSANPETAPPDLGAKATSQRAGASAASGPAGQRVPWEQKPRQWIQRLKGKEAGR